LNVTLLLRFGWFEKRNLKKCFEISEWFIYLGFLKHGLLAAVPGLYNPQLKREFIPFKDIFLGTYSKILLNCKIKDISFLQILGKITQNCSAVKGKSGKPLYCVTRQVVTPSYYLMSESNTGLSRSLSPD
jgi:hypothetical protein